MPDMSDSQENHPTTLKGVCCFHSETGTEGGFWAFQDERFINFTNHHAFVCAKCHRYWDKSRNENEPVPISADDAEKNDELKKWREKQCAPGTHEWQLAFPNGQWSYEGMHILKDGDSLKIFSKTNPQEIAWQGIISLIHFRPFKEDAFGYWIHADQIGVERETWATYFLEEWPAELIPSSESK